VTRRFALIPSVGCRIRLEISGCGGPDG
jgi:hypothetical protein